MPIVRSTLIARRHGVGDYIAVGDTATPGPGASVGAAIGGLLQTLFGSSSAPAAPTVVQSQDNTMLYLGVAAAAGIGIYAFTRRKKR